MQLTTTREDHRIAWLTALAVAIHMLEAALPSPLPGIKPGLANVVVIAVLLRFGWGTAAWVSLLRVLVSGLLLGTFMSPTFMLSLAGAVASASVLWLATRAGALFGPVGYSVLAALGHMSGQFALAFLLFVPHPGLLHLLPILLSVALLFGVVSGILAHNLLRYWPEERQ